MSIRQSIPFDIYPVWLTPDGGNFRTDEPDFSKVKLLSKMIVPYDCLFNKNSFPIEILRTCDKDNMDVILQSDVHLYYTPKSD